MGRTAKIVVAVIFAFTVIGLAGIVAVGVLGYFWIADNAEEVSERSHAARVEGTDHAEGRTTEDCVAAAMPRVEECSSFDFPCHVVAGDFLSACLAAASRSEGFCEGVPSQLDPIAVAGWAQGFCQDHGLGAHQGCINISSEVPRYCHR